MGFFDTARSLASSVLTCGGGILRRIGQISGALRPAVTVIGGALAPVTDGASLAAAGMINKGLGAVSDVAKRATPIAQRISAFGSKLQGYGDAIK